MNDKFCDSNHPDHDKTKPSPVRLSEQQLRDMCKTYGWDDSYQSMRAYRTVEAMSLQANSLES